MRRCAFLTLSDAADFVIDDEHAVGPFAELGWEVTTLPWNQSTVPWSMFDAVIVRSTWDYQHDLPAFLRTMRSISAAGVPLFNPLEVIEWNHAKSYLGDLARRGVPIVPTAFLDRMPPGGVADILGRVGTVEIVLKPLVSGNAQGAFRLGPDSDPAQIAEAEAFYEDRALLAQPFLASVPDEGEYSLMYFDGELSHTIRKTPRTGDYRVQEEHGAEIRAVEASDALRSAGAAVMAALDHTPLYARVDVVRGDTDGGFLLMELELVEPSLYLRMDEGAPARFARAFTARMAADLHEVARR